jgi:hypothetical protein
MAESPLWSLDQLENGWAILSSLSCFYLSYKLLEIERTMIPCHRQLEYYSVSQRLGQVLGFERSFGVRFSSPTP